MFIHLFIHSFVPSFIGSFIHSFIHSFIYIYIIDLVIAGVFSNSRICTREKRLSANYIYKNYILYIYIKNIYIYKLKYIKYIIFVLVHYLCCLLYKIYNILYIYIYIYIYIQYRYTYSFSNNFSRSNPSEKSFPYKPFPSCTSFAILHLIATLK